MTLLTVWKATDPSTPVLETTEESEIREALAELGARFSQDEVLALYADEIGEVKDREGYTLVDVVALDPAQSDYDDVKTPFREKFLSEHAHDDDEDRYFAKGAGVFYLHANEKVHAVYCEAGDLISVPANTTHWVRLGLAS